MSSCLAVLMFTLASVMCASPDPCLPLTDLLAQHNITRDLQSSNINGTEEHTCGPDSVCCSESTVAQLEATVTQDLRNTLQQHFQSTLGMFATTSANLRGELRRLWSESERESVAAVADVGATGRAPTASYYEALWKYLEGGEGDPGALTAHYMQHMFPAVYLGAVHVGGRLAGPKYTACLRAHAAGRLGDVPHRLSTAAGAALPRVRAALAAAALGAEVLGSARGLEPSQPCRTALTRLHHCPRCLGLPQGLKPCSGYCLNVMRGCLSQHELDIPWYNFLVETERFLKDLVRDQDNSLVSFLRSIPTSLSDALIVARVEGPSIEKEMKRLCGSPKVENTTEVEGVEEVSTSPGPPSASARPPSPENYLHHLRGLLAAVENTRARGFYANLPEAICSDDSFAETKDTDHCWNGQRIGEYTKPLVRPEADAQKYNPEVKWTKASPDPNIRALSEKLRFMRMEVVELVSGWRGPSSDSLVSEEGGSGSGAGPYRPGDDEDDYSSSWGSGSGDHATDYDGQVRPRTNHNSKVKENNDSANKVLVGMTGAPPRTASGPTLALPSLVSLLALTILAAL